MCPTALLSRVGHSVVVLEPGDSLGNSLHTLKGVEVDVSASSCRASTLFPPYMYIIL